MNGYISPRLEAVLRDPEARVELQRSLIGRGNGTIRIAGRTFRVAKFGRDLWRGKNTARSTSSPNAFERSEG